jgi:hypothetical protein
MNSDDQKTERIIDDLLKLLGDEFIYNHIVKPVEEVALSFHYAQDGPVTYRFFMKTIGLFVQKVYKFGIRIKQEISEDQAKSIAHMILETGYVGRNSRGFHAAYLDAIDPEIEGFDLVLSQMTEMITSIEHAKHTKWVFENRLGPLDWQTKCRIAEIIIERMATYLPSGLAQCQPAQLSDHLEDLLSLLISSEKAVGKLLLEGTG